MRGGVVFLAASFCLHILVLLFCSGHGCLGGPSSERSVDLFRCIPGRRGGGVAGGGGVGAGERGSVGEPVRSTGRISGGERWSVGEPVRSTSRVSGASDESTGEGAHELGVSNSVTQQQWRGHQGRRLQVIVSAVLRWR